MKKILTVLILIIYLTNNDAVAQNGNCSSITLETSKDRYEIGDFDNVKKPGAMREKSEFWIG